MTQCEMKIMFKIINAIDKINLNGEENGKSSNPGVLKQLKL